MTVAFALLWLGVLLLAGAAYQYPLPPSLVPG
jgi:hypothetical protein